jgi:phosphopantothenoylcysteine decarboxylase/phosphopantothenate--cysteine ligase
MGHIELARWADLILIAPATADAMARLANGHANDLLTTLVLAASAPVALAPAMNQVMWADQSTQANLATLQQRGFHIFGPAAGEQACGDVGLGRMLEPLEIAEAGAALFETGQLAGKHVVITGGPTREALDPVRFLTNHSSGKMAYALAQEAYSAGAKVTLISGPVNLLTPDGVTRIDVTTASEMLATCLQVVDDADIFIGVAAVADYRPATVETTKIKKISDQLEIVLIKNPDIISEVSKLPKRPLIVGFAAETENVVENGTAKLERKNLDLLFANNAVETFNSDNITVTAISKQGNQELPTSTKNVAARRMLSLISDRLN